MKNSICKTCGFKDVCKFKRSFEDVFSGLYKEFLEADYCIVPDYQLEGLLREYQIDICRFFGG